MKCKTTDGFEDIVSGKVSYEAFQFEGVRSFQDLAEELTQYLQRCRLYSENTSKLMSRIRSDLVKLPVESPVHTLITASAYKTVIEWSGKFDLNLAGAGKYSISVRDHIFESDEAIRPEKVDIVKLILASEDCRSVIAEMVEFTRVQNFRLFLRTDQEKFMEEYGLSPDQEYEMQDNFHPIRFHFAFLPLMPFDEDELQLVINAIANGDDPEYEHEFTVMEPLKQESQKPKGKEPA